MIGIFYVHWTSSIALLIRDAYRPFHLLCPSLPHIYPAFSIFYLFITRMALILMLPFYATLIFTPSSLIPFTYYSYNPPFWFHPPLVPLSYTLKLSSPKFLLFICCSFPPPYPNPSYLFLLPQSNWLSNIMNTYGYLWRFVAYWTL